MAAMGRPTISWLLALAVALALACQVATAEASMRLENGTLSGRAAGVSRAALLEEVARLCGVPVEWHGEKASELVAIGLVARPLAEAIAVILAGRSHFLVYEGAGPTARLSRIVVLAPTRSRLAMPVLEGPMRPYAPTPPPLASEAPTPEIVTEYYPSDAREAVIAEMLADPEPGERVRLIGSIVDMNEEDPVRAFLLAELLDDPDAEVRRAARQAQTWLTDEVVPVDAGRSRRAE